MTNGKSALTREGIVADFRMLAEQAEAAGDRVSAVRALKLAWRIERFCPPHPVPPTLDRIITLAEAMTRLMRRFSPETSSGFATMTADLRRCRLDQLEAEREITTLH